MARPKNPHVITHEDRLKAAETRRTKLSYKEKRFCAEYVKTKGNGAQSALIAYDTNKENAPVIAHRNLSKVKVREEIANLLSEQGIEMEEIVAIHARNARQDKHLPTSQKAVTDFYEILGVKPTQNPTGTVQVAFIIEK